MSNWTFPSLNGSCPCRACQRVLGLTPRQREIRKRRKRIDHFVDQMVRIQMKGCP